MPEFLPKISGRVSNGAPTGPMGTVKVIVSAGYVRELAIGMRPADRLRRVDSRVQVFFARAVALRVFSD